MLVVIVVFICVLLWCGCLCSLALPVGWSVARDGGIFWPYSLVCFIYIFMYCPTLLGNLFWQPKVSWLVLLYKK